MLVDCVDNPCSAMPCENEGACEAAISHTYTSISKNVPRYLISFFTPNLHKNVFFNFDNRKFIFI